MDENFHIEGLDDEIILFGAGEGTGASGETTSTSDPSSTPTPSSTVKPYLTFGSLTNITSGYTDSQSTGITDSRSFTASTVGDSSFTVQFNPNEGSFTDKTISGTNSVWISSSGGRVRSVNPNSGQTFGIVLDQNLTSSQVVSDLVLSWTAGGISGETIHYVYQPPQEARLVITNPTNTVQYPATSVTINVESNIQWKLNGVETTTSENIDWFRIYGPNSEQISPETTSTPDVTSAE